LPAGLTLATNGVLSGTPTQPGSFPIVVTVTDANGCTGTGSTYTLVISCQTITVTNPTNTNGMLNAPFSETFTQSGSIGTATFTTASTLPAGLTLATNGVLSGTPTQWGDFPIVVTVTDSNGCTGTGSTYNLFIDSGALIFAEGGVGALDSPSLRSIFMLPLTPSTFEAKRDDRNATNISNSISRSLTEAELNATVALAIQRWFATGLTQKQIATVLRLKFEVADLSGRYLGEANSNRILISRDAQGKGWFIDSNPLSDLNFARAVSATRLYAAPWGAPAGHIDLLTALEHEIGHKLGLNDTYAERDRDNLMYGYLTVGERRLPGQNQARYARAGSHACPHFISLGPNEKTDVRSKKSGLTRSNHARSLKLETRSSKPLATTANPIPCATTSSHVCVDVGTLRPGKSVTITFSLTVNTPYGGGSSISNQGTVSGGNFSDVVTNDPDTGAANDSTVTPICGSSLVVTNTGDGGNGSLRQAILNLCPGGTITFDPALTTGGPATITLLSELVIDKIVTINGSTNNGLTISGNNASRIFNINSGASLSIATLTIANGRGITGGGILSAGTLTVNNSTINNNRTIDGADATGATNGGNGGNGGAIYNTGTLTLINSTVGGNQTGRGGDNLSGTTGNGGNSGSGAGIYSTGTVQMTNTTVTDNQTGRVGRVAPTDPPGLPGTLGTGGGVSNNGGTLTFNNTIVANNRDGFNNEDDINGAVDSSSSFNFIGSSAGFTGIGDGSNGNQIGMGESALSPLLGALADNGGPTRTYLPQVGSPVIDAGSNALAKDQSNNDLTTDQRGTGFPRIVNGTVEIGSVESTEAPVGAGTDLTVSKAADVEQIVPGRDITYTITVRNIGSDAATSTTVSDTLPQVPTSSSSTSMTFVSLTAAPGWTCTTPSVGSGGTISCTRASVAGSSVHTFTLVANVPSSAEPNPDDPFITNVVTVSAANDPNNENDSGSASTLLLSCLSNPVVITSADSGAGSLRQAIADACAGSTITFDMTPGHVTSPITLTSAELLVNKNLTIQGPGANTLTVMRSTAVGTANFHIVRITSGNTVAISGLTLTNGFGTSGLATNGGGISNEGTLIIRNSVLTGNTAENGGGMFNQGGTLTVINSTISNNHADTGSGGGVISSGPLTIINSTISGNTAFRTGGIEVGAGIADITNTTISGNLAIANGGGVQTLGGAATLTNVTVTNNHSDQDNNADGSGGGLRNGSGSITLRNTIIAGNFKGAGTSTANDIDQNIDPSSSFNLIGTGGSGGLGNSSGNQVGVASALVGALANNGGPTQTHLLLPGSPAINTGSNALLPADSFDLDGDSNTVETLPVDQRGTGFARVTSTTVDIGAVEVNYLITATAGTPQSAAVNTAFAVALRATVTESGTAQSGLSVTFTAPTSGAGGTFPGPSTTAVVATNSSGEATAPTFTANATSGAYNVVASIAAGQPTATFALTNNKLNQTITFGALSGKTFGDADFPVSATSDSGLAVSFAATGNCTVTSFSPGTVHLTGPGSCTITASQGGDSGYNAATNVVQSFDIAKAGTTTSLSSSINPSDIGQNVTFTATITTPSNTSTPTGTVQFKDGANNLGSAVNCVTDGGNTCTAQVSTSSLTTGTHAISATYSGDTNLVGSSGSLAGGQTVSSQQALLLILDESGPDPNQAAALDSLLLLRDPFPIQSVAEWLTFGPDRNTRVMVFVANLQLNSGETSSAVVVNLVGSNSQSYAVPAEDIRFDLITGFAQVTFRLPDTLFPGACTVKVEAHGHISNSAIIRIGP
jgi:hypothetical protein